MNLLFVCTGNTCRSPMLKCVADSVLDKEKYATRSRGLCAFDGEGASEGAIYAAEKNGLSLVGHKAQSLSSDDILWADLIICLSASHKNAIDAFLKEHNIKKTVEVLGTGISDPFGQDNETYLRCFDEIKNAFLRRAEDGF